MDRGSNAVWTDGSGFHGFDSAYPLCEWLIMEAYSDIFYTTGITYQADNRPTKSTVMGAGVDVSVLPIARNGHGGPPCYRAARPPSGSPWPFVDGTDTGMQPTRGPAPFVSTG